MLAKLNVLAESKHWIVVDKPAGLNVEQLWDYPSVEQEVRDYLTEAGRKPPYVGIVHRLDRPVSGVLLLAKKKSSLKILNEQFAQRSVKKIYWAITERTPEVEIGTLIHYLAKDQKNKRALAYAKIAKGRIRAELEYQKLAQVTRSEKGVEKIYSKLEIRPITGKFHQIRIQLATVGCPIVGDVKYGAEAGEDPFEIALHARTLTFQDPHTGEEVRVTAQPPAMKIWQLGRQSE